MSIRLVGGPTADEGEIVITGPQLARGYLGDPVGTIGVFRIVDSGGVPVPAYYTGDWAKRIGKHVFFAGRQDFQVKILGHRLELTSGR